MSSVQVYAINYCIDYMGHANDTKVINKEVCPHRKVMICVGVQQVIVYVQNSPAAEFMLQYIHYMPMIGLCVPGIQA